MTKEAKRANSAERKSAIRFVALIAAAAALGPSAALAQAHGQWTTPAGDLEGTRYSALTDITNQNVGGLVEEFSAPTNSRFSHQGGPLVVGSVMYVVTPYPNRLIAFDLTHPGAVLWTFSPAVNLLARGVACCDAVNRGASYSAGMIVYNTLDDTTVAVNAKTGAQVWRTKLGDPTTGETLTGAPIVVNNKVIVGNAGGELGVRGWVQALDLATGKALWKAYNTGPDADVMIGRNFHAYYSKDQGVDLGATTWPSSMWQQGGATSWAWLTYDPDLNLLFYGTSNPGVWNPDMRPGDNKWASTIIARDPDTGQAVWAYQLVGHDGWDYDAVNESIVANLPIGGTLRKVIVHFNKNGFAYTIDRSTGQVLVANPFRQQTWTTGINLATGIPAVADGFSPHQGQITHNICPSPLGGKDWEPAAFSFKTGLFYIPSINVCDDLEPLLTEYIAGTPFWGANYPLHPGPGGYKGELIAWNASEGARAWSVKEPLPIYSGVLATSGNVVFYGTLDKHFKALNATTGQLLFDKVLECGIVSNPISYTAPDGKQRIAVMTGVGWFAGNVVGGGTCPPTGGGGNAATLAAPTSGYVHVFKLP